MHTDQDQLTLQLVLPAKELMTASTNKIIAKAVNGEFCILPNHIDFVSILQPSVLSYWSTDIVSQPSYVAIDHGVLVKCGNQVTVSIIDGLYSDDLQLLQDKVKQHFIDIDEHERKARAALARIEAVTLRRFRELQEPLHDFI